MKKPSYGAKSGTPSYFFKVAEGQPAVVFSKEVYQALQSTDQFH